MIKDNQHLLTIAIPTFNRPEQLETQLSILLPQLNAAVKVVILDNHSDTPASIEQNCYDIKIIRNRINIGGDANIFRCFEICETKWLWTLSDDDYIKSNAVSLVLSAIRNYPEVSWINFAGESDTEVMKGKDEFFNSFTNSGIFSNSYWISKCVYNTELLSDAYIYYARSLSSQIGQLVLVAKHSFLNPNATFVRKDDLLLEQTPPGGWRFSEFIKNNTSMIEAFTSDELKVIKCNLLKTLIRWNIRSLIFLPISYWERLYILQLNIVRYGVIKSFCRFPLLILMNLIIGVLPYTIVNNIKNSIKKCI